LGQIEKEEKTYLGGEIMNYNNKKTHEERSNLET